VADKARKTRFDPALNVPDKIAAAAYANGVVFRAFGDGVLGFAPALSFTAGEFDLMFERVRKTLDDVLADPGVQRALDAAHAQPA
jgi:adenosylmethionine-8-amino-7-oxononanoate aminotransferase